MPFHSDAVSCPVSEELPVSSVLDLRAGGLIHVRARYAGPASGTSCAIGRQHDLGYLLQFRVDLANRKRPREIGYVTLGGGTPIYEQ
jgi:hypothetical protein